MEDKALAENVKGDMKPGMQLEAGNTKLTMLLVRFGMELAN